MTGPGCRPDPTNRKDPMPRFQVYAMGPATMLFVWWRGHEWVIPLDWPCASHTGAGTWSW